MKKINLAIAIAAMAIGTFIWFAGLYGRGPMDVRVGLLFCGPILLLGAAGLLRED